MILKQTELNRFRNLSLLSLNPSENVNVFYGENAQGKTNLLEALWLFTGCKSFRGTKESELIAFGMQNAKLKAEIVDKTRRKTAEIWLGEPRKASLNGVEKPSASALIGEFYAVVFSPAHLALIQSGPLQRRRFLDTALCELKPKYAETLSSFRRALLQRNTLLKDLYKNAELFDLLDSWDVQFARLSAEITRDRLRYICLLAQYCSEIYGGISENKEKLEFSYQCGAAYSAETELRDVCLDILERLKKARKDDLFLKSTSVGPHRDDLFITINGLSAKQFGSQGQQRSGALALKLGEAEIIKKVTGEMPVALLDDVMSELDEKRQDYVLNHITDRQVFLTCCDPSQVIRRTGGSLYYVENGRITEKK